MMALVATCSPSVNVWDRHEKSQLFRSSNSNDSPHPSYSLAVFTVTNLVFTVAQAQARVN